MADTDLNEMDNHLVDLDNNLDSEVLKLLTLKALEIKDLAQLIVPVRTGYLRDHIEVNVIENGENDYSIEIAVDVSYAAIVEERQPYLAPAIAQVEPTIQPALEALQESLIQ
jgi:hypothetical protein